MSKFYWMISKVPSSSKKKLLILIKGSFIWLWHFIWHQFCTDVLTQNIFVLVDLMHGIYHSINAPLSKMHVCVSTCSHIHNICYIFLMYIVRNACGTKWNTTIVAFIPTNSVRLDELNKEWCVLLKLHLLYTQVSACCINADIEYTLGFLY